MACGWVRFLLGGVEILIFTFPHFDNKAKRRYMFRHLTRNASRIRRKMQTGSAFLRKEYLNTGSQVLSACAEYSGNLWKMKFILIKTDKKEEPTNDL